MAAGSPKRAFVTVENKRQRIDMKDCTWSIPMMTAGLGRRDAPTLASLYKPKNMEHELSRAKLFEQAAVNCRKYPVRGKLVHVRQAFDFICDRSLCAHLPQDFWQGVFEEQHIRFLAQDSGELQYSEEFLMAYINSLEATVLALETERAIAMFAEGEEVTVDSLTLKMYLPFSDAMEQQDLIDKAVQKEIDSRIVERFFRFLSKLSIPAKRRLLDLMHKLELYQKRAATCSFANPFYSAKVFRRTLNQANSWFFAEEERAMSLVENKAYDRAEFIRRYVNPTDWLSYEENAMSRALTTRNAKEEHAFILQTKHKMLGWGGCYLLTAFFYIYWELQERERKLSIVTKVEAWVKCHCVT